MKSTYGKNLKLEISGSSHSPEIVLNLKGMPQGIVPDFELIKSMMDRRSPGKPGTTQRKESDRSFVVSGMVPTDDGFMTDGSVISVVIANEDAKPKDYEEMKNVPRPGHGDYTYFAKTGEFVSGGATSARLTALITWAGGLCAGELKKKGISIKAELTYKGNSPAGDSAGGIVECTVTGLVPGFGAPYFGKIESAVSSAVFSIPAVKGVEFGAGFAAAKMLGSENNDAFYFEKGTVKTRTNNAGGVLGGMATGMPLIFRAAFKPTPSISLEQETVNLETGESVKLSVPGRHDPCAAMRAPAIVEAAAALALYDIFLGEKWEKTEKEDSLPAARKRIDKIDEELVELFKARMEESKKVACIKHKAKLPTENLEREEEVKAMAERLAGPELEAYTRELFEKLIDLSKSYQKEKQ